MRVPRQHAMLSVSSALALCDAIVMLMLRDFHCQLVYSRGFSRRIINSEIRLPFSAVSRTERVQRGGGGWWVKKENVIRKEDFHHGGKWSCAVILQCLIGLK